MTETPTNPAEEKSYVLADYFGGTGGGASEVIGPFTFDEADNLLRQGAAICGKYRSNQGYHSDLPCWWAADDYGWMMRKLHDDFSEALRLAEPEE
jgi:hypothetical protein